MSEKAAGCWALAAKAVALMPAHIATTRAEIRTFFTSGFPPKLLDFRVSILSRPWLSGCGLVSLGSSGGFAAAGYAP
jgi:hypothetical protein